MDAIRFSGIGVWRAEFPLRVQFSHNLASRNKVETLLVAVRTAGGTVGYGQAIPRSYLTGESVASAMADIRERWWPELSRHAIPGSADFAGALAALEPIFETADALRLNASYAAAEIAALDAFARERGIPAAALPLSAEGTIPLVGVISAASPAKAAWTARIMHWLGYRHFKVKVGRDERADGERLQAVRRAVGGSAWLAVDANAAWEADEAVRRIAGLHRFGVALVEEPLNSQTAGETDFANLEREAGIAVMADESLCTLADARALLARGSPSWWNLRLAKNGGFSGVFRLAALARAADINVYGGILVGETSILAAAARSAIFSTHSKCAEYGFPRVFLRGDPFRGGPGGYTGKMTPVPAQTVGLGVVAVGDIMRGNGELVWSAGDYRE